MVFGLIVLLDLVTVCLAWFGVTLLVSLFRVV